MVVHDESHDGSGDGTADADHPEEPVLLGPGEDGLAEHEATDEATPSGKEGCANFDEISEEETDDDSASDSDAEEDPERGQIGFICHENGVVQETGHKHRCQEPSKAHRRSDQFTSQEGEQDTDHDEEGTEVSSVLCKVLPDGRDVENGATVFGDQVDLRVALVTVDDRVVGALEACLAQNVDGESARLVGSGAVGTTLI